MTIMLEVAAGVVLTGTLLVALTVLAAAELGRAIGRDDEQHEPISLLFDLGSPARHGR